MWLYGHDFREFQSFRVLIRPNQEKQKTNIKSAEFITTMNSTILCCWIRPFNIFKHKQDFYMSTHEVVSVRNLSALLSVWWTKMAHEKWSPSIGPWWEPDFVTGWFLVTVILYSEVKCSSNGWEFHIFGHLVMNLKYPRPLPTSSPLSLIFIWCLEPIPGIGFRVMGL